jgi:hypothetical protein
VHWQALCAGNERRVRLQRFFERHPGAGLAVSLLFTAIGAIILITEPHGHSPRSHLPNAVYAPIAIAVFGLVSIGFLVRLVRGRR